MCPCAHVPMFVKGCVFLILDVDVDDVDVDADMCVQNSVRPLRLHRHRRNSIVRKKGRSMLSTHYTVSS